MVELNAFIAQWKSAQETMVVHTSGSTGAPKAIVVRKEQMRNSAHCTCQFLQLTEADTALLCMPMRYIAGKMMVVRALEWGMRIIAVPPSRRPLRNLPEIPTFAAMTPMQVIATLQVADECAALKQIRQLIIGGGPISPELSATLRTFPHAVWSTYGMTETLSHIALRRLSGAAATERYTPLPGVAVDVTPTGQLTIHAPHVCSELLVTNDVAKLYADGTFAIVGRVDNVINSGGIKLQIETIEEALKPHLAAPFFITATTHKVLGEVVTLLMEADQPTPSPSCFATLPPYWQPRRIAKTPQLPYTETGKPNRAAARTLAERDWQEM